MGVIRHGAERHIDCGNAALWKNRYFCIKGGSRRVRRLAVRQESVLWTLGSRSKPSYRSMPTTLTLVYDAQFNLNHTLQPLSETLRLNNDFHKTFVIRSYV